MILFVMLQKALSNTQRQPMQRFADSVRKTSSILCVGLDPPVAANPRKRFSRILPAPFGSTTARQIRSIIKKTQPHAAAYKVNLAFYLARGSKGIDLLLRIRDWTGDTPLILDGKFNDIDNTLEGYATFAAAAGVTAVTASPYMGEDFSPFTKKGMCVFVLGTTTNIPDIQGLQLVSDAGTLARHVALKVSDRPAHYGLVVGHDAAGMRELCPETWFLSPGLGAQGKQEKEILQGLRPDGLGLLVNASRSIWTATDPAAAARKIVNTLGQSLQG